MIRRLLLLTLVVFVPSVVFAQVNRDAIAKQLEAQERASGVAIQKGDVAGFKALVADDALRMDGTGLMALSEFVKMFSQMKLETFTVDQVKVIFLNDTAAIVTSRWSATGTWMGQPLPSPVLTSTAYANRGGKWVAVYMQDTVPTPPLPGKK